MSAIEHHDPQDYYPDDFDDAGDCWMCGGEGYLEGECTCGEDCCCCLYPTPPRCPECRRHEIEAKYKRTRAARIAVLRAIDIDAGILWLKRQDRWTPTITQAHVLLHLHAARTGEPDFTEDERTASACWVEGLI